MDVKDKQDNRKQQRVLLTEKLLVDIKKDFQCIDISEGGLYLSIGNIFAENCLFDVTIPYKNKKVTVKAQIRHFQTGVGVGIEFVDVSEGQRAIINEIIESIMSHYKADREDKILLIEDHDMSRKINRINLVEDGFLVIEARDGMEGNEPPRSKLRGIIKLSICLLVIPACRESFRKERFWTSQNDRGYGNPVASYRELSS